MPERNPCYDLGCAAECCRNTIGRMPLSESFFLKAFPEAFKIDSTTEEDLKQKIRDQDPGVFYFIDHDWTYFSVSGVCPNLAEDINCKIHSETFYPHACARFVVKSMSCIDAREIYKASSYFTVSGTVPTK